MVCGLLVSASAYVVQAAVLRLETMQAARQVSAADFEGSPDRFEVTRLFQDGAPLVRVSLLSKLWLAGLPFTLEDSQLAVSQVGN